MKKWNYNKFLLTTINSTLFTPSSHHMPHLAKDLCLCWGKLEASQGEEGEVVQVGGEGSKKCVFQPRCATWLPHLHAAQENLPQLTPT